MHTHKLLNRQYSRHQKVTTNSYTQNKS